MDKKTKNIVLIGGGIALLYFILKPKGPTNVTTGKSNLLNPVVKGGVVTNNPVDYVNQGISIFKDIKSLFKSDTPVNPPVTNNPPVNNTAPDNTDYFNWDDNTSNDNTGSYGTDLASNDNLTFDTGTESGTTFE